MGHHGPVRDGFGGGRLRLPGQRGGQVREADGARERGEPNGRGHGWQLLEWEVQFGDFGGGVGRRKEGRNGGGNEDEVRGVREGETAAEGVDGDEREDARHVLHHHRGLGVPQFFSTGGFPVIIINKNTIKQ